jgi:hypothetical protein
MVDETAVAVIVFVLMDSSLFVEGTTLAVPLDTASESTSWLRRNATEANQAEEGINRYRIGWDANAKADSPDSAADTPGSATSTRRAGQAEDANCDFSAASMTVNIALTL